MTFERIRRGGLQSGRCLRARLWWGHTITPPILRAFACVCVALVASAETAFATPFTYSESVSGDLGMFLPSSKVFALTLGDNTVSGHLFYTTSTFDFDSFAFSVPNGDVLAAANFEWTLTHTIGVTTATITFSLKGANAGSPTLASNTFSVLSSGSIPLFTTALPHGAGTFAIADNSEAIGGGGNSARWDADYTWHLTVANPVPEPASLMLLASGLAMVGRRLASQRLR